MEDPVASPSGARGGTPTKSRLTDFAMAAFRRVSDSPAVLAAAAAAHLPLSSSPRNSVQLPPKSGANWSTNSAFESGHETEETASSVLKNNLTDETSSNEHDSVDDARKSPPAAAQQQQQLAQARGAQAFASVSSPTGLRGRSQAAHGASPVKEAAAGYSSPSESVTPRSRQQQQGGAASPARSGSLFKKLSAAHRLFTASGPESGEEEGQEDPDTTHVIPFHQEFGSAQQQQRQPFDASPALYTLHDPEGAAAAWEQEIKRMMTAGNMLFEALERPAPSMGLVRCCVRRIKTFFGRNSVFELHMERSNQLLLAARKRKKSKVSAYVISSDADDLKRDGDSCIAKLKANFVGTEYVLWGKSDDPAVRKGFASEQLCLSFKPSGIEGGPHTMHAALPVPDGTSAAFASSSGAWRQAAVAAAAADGAMEAAEGAHSGGTGSMLGELLDQAKGGKTLASDVERGLALLCSKPPEYDEAIKAYLLDFGGRVKQYSVKNFQLVCWDHNLDRKGSQVVLQFGKVSEDVYALDFAYPLSIQTAFGAALAKLDTKLCYMLG